MKILFRARVNMDDTENKKPYLLYPDGTRK